MQNDACAARIVSKRHPIVANLLMLAIGACFLSICAQISIHLPFTPVPLTGQTFGVSLLALLYGSRRAIASFATYLALGLSGLPIMAGGQSLILFGATSGYLAGMCIASFVIGYLADRGWSRQFHLALGASVIGSLITYGCGLFVLGFFVPHRELLAVGLIPFLIGDLVKDILASQIAVRLSNRG